MKLFFVSGWATKNSVWKSVMEILMDKQDAEVVDWWKAINGELDRRIAENAERCIVAGWSMGGQIALQAAARNPDNLAGLFLVSSMSCLVERGGRPGVSGKIPHQIQIMLERNRRVFLRAFFTQCLHPMKDARIIENLLNDSDSFSMATLLAGLEYMAEMEAVLTLKVPLMTVHGRGDHVIPWECSEYISRHAAHSSEEYLEKAGHLLPVVKPEIVGNLLNEFSEYCIAR